MIKQIKIALLAAAAGLVLMAGGCKGQEARTQAESQMETEAAAAGDEAAGTGSGKTQAAAEDAPHILPGTYHIQVDSSSSMFRITDCVLTVTDQSMTARMTMGGTGYLKLYMGRVMEAEKASDEDCIPYIENPDGTHSFEVPVEALDQPIFCSAFSKRKETWYERTLVFRSDSISGESRTDFAGKNLEELGLEDGQYTVEARIQGGSGRASIQSPADLRIREGKAFLTLEWNSSNYDYMKVGEEKYEPLSTEGNSAFEIPVELFDAEFPVTADTIAMSQPHEIQYQLYLDSSTIKKAESAQLVELSYADQFSIEHLENGCTLLNINDSGRFLLVPEGWEGELPSDTDLTVLQLPLENLYLAATSAMDFFARLDGVDRITLSGTKEDGWYIKEAKDAMAAGNMTYAGKYNAPDYEKILAGNCRLAIESTMILHSPEVKEQLERVGVPVLVERSSYEKHPLGRMEWIKVYGALLGKEAEAEAMFQKEKERLEPVLGKEPLGKTVAFFYITSKGTVNVRKPDDYVAKMIELAGGTYILGEIDAEENALSTTNMQLEAFYQAAKDADCLIYNSTTTGELDSMEDLLEKWAPLKDFKAVQQNNVWCTEENLFQETMGLGEMILDIHRVLSEEKPEGLTYLKPLR